MRCARRDYSNRDTSSVQSRNARDLTRRVFMDPRQMLAASLFTWSRPSMPLGFHEVSDGALCADTFASHLRSSLERLTSPISPQ